MSGRRSRGRTKRRLKYAVEDDRKSVPDRKEDG